MTETEFADYLRDVSMLADGSIPQAATAVLRAAADFMQVFDRGTADAKTVAQHLRQAAARYPVPEPLCRAAVRAWTDRFDNTGEQYGFADRYSVS